MVEPVTSSNVAEIEVVPRSALDTRPCEPAALLTVALSVSLDTQVAIAVRSCVGRIGIGAGRGELLAEPLGE